MSMLANYFLLAWRAIQKNKRYAAINILGLTVGLLVYVFGTLFVNYEHSHDLFWKSSQRIFTVGTVFGPAANVGVAESDGIYTAFAPLIKTELTEVEAVARTVGREFLVSIDDTHYYHDIRFADPALLRIFDFDYLEGAANALDDPRGVVITRAIRDKFFAGEPALGRTFTLDHNVELHVTAVIEAVPANTHFTSSLTSDGDLEIIAPLDALNGATGYDLAGNFNNLSSGDNTYILLPASRDLEWLQASMDGLFERHYPGRDSEFIGGLKVRPLQAMNTVIWDAVGLPVMDSVRLLALLVLVVAIVNYTNLATAQSLSRTREIGLRKTLGATRGQLITQFLVESVTVVAIAMLLCVVLLMLIVPQFNAATNKVLVLDWFTTGPWLLATTLLTGLIAGAYPAYMITRTSPIEALRAGGPGGSHGSAFRTGMLILQFAISVFMLAMVSVVYLQNKKIEESSQIYPKEQIITLSRLRIESIQARLDTLKNELQRIPGVHAVTYASQLPFEQSDSNFSVSLVPGDDTNDVMLNQIYVDGDFFETMHIPVLRGRTFDDAISMDTFGDTGGNVIVNQLALNKLGIADRQDIIGTQFFDLRDEGGPRTYTIVGVIPDQLFQGFHNEIKPVVFINLPRVFRQAAIRADASRLAEVRQDVEAAWDRLITDYPVQSGYLEDEFQDTYDIYRSTMQTLGAFALVAMSLSLIGLFGLAAFMAATRTREIGIRKVLGASSAQLTRLLVWRFSKPVLWALLIALPLAYLAAGEFLNFFADRIQAVSLIVLSAGLAAMFIAWCVVGLHALRVAGANPINALRHE